MFEHLVKTKRLQFHLLAWDKAKAKVRVISLHIAPQPQKNWSWPKLECLKCWDWSPWNPRKYVGTLLARATFPSTSSSTTFESWLIMTTIIAMKEIGKICFERIPVWRCDQMWPEAASRCSAVAVPQCYVLSLMSTAQATHTLHIIA